MNPVVAELMSARSLRSALRIPSAVAALSPEQGYALQRLHEAALLDAFDGRRVGTKLGGGTLDELAAMGLSGPIRGPILSAFVHKSPVRLPRGEFFIAVVEAEIAVVLARDLGGDGRALSRDEVANAIAAVLPAIEVADSRWSNFKEASAGAILADAGFAGAWIGGEPVRDWRAIDLAALPVRLLRGSEEIASGRGMRAMGDPLLAVCAALADLARDGEGMKAGEVISTGTCTAPYMARTGDELLADFGPLGQVRVHFC